METEEIKKEKTEIEEDKGSHTETPVIAHVSQASEIHLQSIEKVISEIHDMLDTNFTEVKDTIGIISDNVNKHISNQTSQTVSYLDELLEKMTGKIVKEINSVPKVSETMEIYVDKISKLLSSQSAVKTIEFKDIDIYKDLQKEHQETIIELEKLQGKIQSLEKEIEDFKSKSLDQKKLIKEKSEQIFEMTANIEKMKASGGYSAKEDELAKELENKNKLMEKLVSNVKSLVEEKKELVKEKEKAEKEKAEAEEAKKTFEKKLKESASKLSNKLNEIDRSDIKIKEAEKKHRELQNKLEASERELKALKNDLEKKDIRISQLSKELEEERNKGGGGLSGFFRRK